MRSSNIDALFAILRAGLWEREVGISQYGDIDFTEIYRLAEEQSVVGLLAAGLEHVRDAIVPKDNALTFAGTAIQLEQKNLAMNKFVADLVAKMRRFGIYTLLVKGQGLAQSYEKPLWRACGDVDFFLSEENYQKAKEYLLPQAVSVEPEGIYNKHLGMTIDSWAVELHGNLRCGLSPRIDRVLEDVLDDTFHNGNVRSWDNGGVQVFMLGMENDTFYVFTHFLGHFYKGGIGLRQICDWCRLLWTYREGLNLKKLESLIRAAGLVSEWKAFGTFAVEYLGMPEEAMPLYTSGSKCYKKAKRICRFIMMVGNFGHNRDMSFYRKGSYLGQKVKSFGRRLGDLSRHFQVFPWDTIRYTPYIVFNGIRSAVRGE